MEAEHTSHDQLFKELLRAFFHEFMDLFFPRTAARLDFPTTVFLDKEVFTDIPEGALREPDLVARVQTHDGRPELILIHVEVQARRDRAFGERMLEYYMLLRLRFRLPVFPVVLYLERGAGGLGIDRIDEALFDEPVLTFYYRRVGVPDLPAEDYLEGDNPLAYGLAALMQTGERHPAEIKAEALLKIARAVIDEARKLLLANCVETYLELDDGERLLFEELVRQPAHEEVSAMVSVYEVRGKRDAVLLLLREKFGELPEAAKARIEAMETVPELDAVLKAILPARSLADLGLANAGGNGTEADKA